MSLAAVEAALQSLDKKYAESRRIREQLGSGERVLHLEEIVSGLRGRMELLSAETDEGRKKTREVVGKVRTIVATSDGTLGDIVAKRQKEAKALETKAASIESVFQQLKTEGTAAERHLLTVIREEIGEVSGNFERRLSEERASLLQQLQAMKTSQSQAVHQARKQARHTLQSLSDYTRDNADKLSILKATSLMSQNRLNSEDAKALILTEVTARLFKGISSMKEHMEGKCTMMSTKHTDELARLKTEVEAAKEMILGQREEVTPPADPSPVARLTNYNADIRRLLNHIGAFCIKGIKGVRENTAAVKRSQAVIDQEGISEQGQNLLKEVKKQLEICSEQLSSISTKIKSDFYGVVEALKEGKVLIALGSAKLAADQKPSFDVQKDLRSRLEKEVRVPQYSLTRERVEKLLTETQEEIRTLKAGQEHWSQQLTAKHSSFDSPSGSGGEELRASDDDFDDL